MADSMSIRIARRVAAEIEDGSVVNLGIGIPLLVPDFLPDGSNCVIHQESGYLGMGEPAAAGKEDPTLTDAAGQPVTLLGGASCFDSGVSFCVVRGGRLDCAVLGALEVDAEGNLANWIVPGKWSPGVGGGMELAQKARRVIVATRQTAKDGTPKILERCRLPLTAPRCVDTIVTEYAVFRVRPDGLYLVDLIGEASIDQLRTMTGAPFSVALGIAA
jgi:acetate CoA/acetoacetate CoA-transferase beta subunit